MARGSVAQSSSRVRRPRRRHPRGRHAGRRRRLVSELAANGFPDLAAIQKIGEMDQATSVFDEQDRLAFTIYKEQRIEVPLDQVSSMSCGR